MAISEERAALERILSETADSLTQALDLLREKLGDPKIATWQCEDCGECWACRTRALLAKGEGDE